MIKSVKLSYSSDEETVTLYVNDQWMISSTMILTDDGWNWDQVEAVENMATKLADISNIIVEKVYERE